MTAIRYILNGIIEFLVTENAYLDAKIESLCGLKTEIWVLIGFMYCGNGSY